MIIAVFALMMASTAVNGVPAAVIEYYYCAAAEADLIELSGIPKTLKPEDIAKLAEKKCNRFHDDGFKGFLDVAMRDPDAKATTQNLSDDQRRKLAHDAFIATSRERLIKHITEFQSLRSQ